MSDASATDALLDDAPCGFVSFSDDGRLRVVNRTLLDLLGFERDELTGRHIESILAVGSRIFYQTHFFPVLRLHGRADEMFLLLRPKGGGDVAVLTNAVRREREGEWVTDAVFLRLQERRKFEDALLAAKRAAEEARAAADAQRREVEAANDLLERQAIELERSRQRLLKQADELEAQRSVAEEANRAKSAFLAMMSHELRTPLNAIGGYVQLLEMGVHGPVTDAQAGALARVARSQRHLLRMINELLDLARIEAGKIDYDMQVIAIDEVVRATYPMVETQLAARGLRFDADASLALAAYADREKVQQIMLNLLSNAAKFTARNGSITVLGRIAADHPDRVEVSVRDTGIGIPADRLEQIFQPFAQVESALATRVEGTGLGLSISRELARGMGGEIVVESTLGAGSTFTLRLTGA